MEENHLHCRTEANGADSNRKVALITGITGKLGDNCFFDVGISNETFYFQVRMVLTWLNFCWTKATQFMESSGGVHLSTLAGYHTCTMIQSPTDKER